MRLFNDVWTALFPNAAENMEYNHSDHRPLYANSEYYNQPEAPKNGQQNWFETWWLREESFNANALEAWTKVGVTPSVTRIYEKLNKTY